MPWFGQVKHGAGYIAIASTPWNGGVYAEHPANGPYTHVGTWWEPSLGKMDYRRCLEYTFLNNCDYNDLCKVYRNYVKEHGLFTSLEEKAARVPSVNDLIGCSFVHCGIKTNVNPKSDFYDPENPEKNNFITTLLQGKKRWKISISLVSERCTCIWTVGLNQDMTTIILTICRLVSKQAAGKE